MRRFWFGWILAPIVTAIWMFGWFLVIYTDKPKKNEVNACTKKPSH